MEIAIDVMGEDKVSVEAFEVPGTLFAVHKDLGRAESWKVTHSGYGLPAYWNSREAAERAAQLFWQHCTGGYRDAMLAWKDGERLPPPTLFDSLLTLALADRATYSVLCY
jgi:hypothetical protein